MVSLRNRPLRVVLLAALVCAGGVAAAADEQVFGYEDWRRAVARLPLDPAEVVYPFHATAEMAAWARQKTATYAAAGPEVRLQALQQAFFDKGEFEFEYEQARTLTAEEAFAARHGNCMSFTSLFIALARSLDYPVVMVTVERQPEVEREGSLVVVNRHVVAGYRSPQKLYTYDFYVSSATPVTSRRVLDDVAASAIYHTNIGGHAIRVEDLEEAVRNLRIATVLAPGWAPAWVNLGVALSRMGDTEGAFDAFRRALEEEPGNSSALVNLARLYREQGREEEADNAIRAAAEGTRNPFTLISLADAEMLRGEYGKALQHLRRARWWYAREPAVYDALARLASAQGEHEKAARYRQRAAELRAEQTTAAPLQ
jgi:Flp pilus assembly protein TadD